jgi:transketolase
MSNNIEHLKEMAKKIRKHVLMMFMEAGSGHPGGSLSVVEIITSLYFYKMRHNPNDPKWPERDRFVLSKGHAAPTLYAALAESGYFPVEELRTLRKLGSRLQGHPDMAKLPGVEISTGSLGLGFSVAVGMALAGRLDGRNYRVFVLLGDGETQEGQIWEAAMASSHYRLDNLTAILDRNGLQLDGPTERIMSIEPIVAKWQAFGWHVLEVDGYEIGDIMRALDEADTVKGKPTVIIAHDVKGRGIPFMEWNADFHGKVPDKESLMMALQKLC